MISCLSTTYLAPYWMGHEWHRILCSLCSNFHSIRQCDLTDAQLDSAQILEGEEMCFTYRKHELQNKLTNFIGEKSQRMEFCVRETSQKFIKKLNLIYLWHRRRKSTYSCQSIVSCEYSILFWIPPQSRCTQNALGPMSNFIKMAFRWAMRRWRRWKCCAH